MAGEIRNPVVVHAEYPKGTPLEDQTETCVVKTAAVDATKLEVSLVSSSGASAVKIGEKISNYSIVVKNNCNVTLSNIKVNDALPKTDADGNSLGASYFEIESLEPGKSSSVLVTESYIVALTDISDDGKIINSAIAKGYYKKSESDEVEVTSKAAYAENKVGYIEVSVPTAPTNFVYNGCPQNGVEANDAYEIVSGESATDAGAYSTELKLNSWYK